MEGQSQSAQHRHNTLLRKRQNNSGMATDKDLLAVKLNEFKNSPSSLRISASQVSALVGLHPFQNLPQLLFDLVYQSYLGQQLLQIDAAALGLSLVDAKKHEEEQMINLATAVSKETKHLIQQVLEVSSGKRKLESVDEVQSIQKKIATQARDAQNAGRMSQRQVETLMEASRGHVSTGFGTCHEDEALDIYEKRVGCVVRERNEDLMEWMFERINFEGETGVSAVPMGTARRRTGWNGFRQEQQQIMKDQQDLVTGDKSDSVDIKSCLVKDPGSTQSELFREKRSGNENTDENAHGITNDPSLIPDEYEQNAESSNAYVNKTDDDSPTQPNRIRSENDPSDMIDLTIDEKHEKLACESPRVVFFKIVGAVDGIRDEIYVEKPSPPSAVNAHTHQTTSNTKGEFSDDELDQLIADYKTPSKEKKSGHCDETFDDECNMALRPIIVECKHRMKKASIPPPLYDQIQTCIYCQMHETEDADLIQVVRNNAKPSSNASAKQNEDNNQHIEITISRISLNDPIHNHKYHWTATILPRLASFVDAVYTIRKDDTSRYRMLMALVAYQDENAGTSAEKDAWQVLWDQCPWLKYCDTAFGRR